MVDLHPGLEMFHIGADECYHIKDCDECAKKPETEDQLKLQHIAHMAQYVKSLSIPRFVISLIGSLRELLSMSLMAELSKALGRDGEFVGSIPSLNTRKHARLFS